MKYIICKFNKLIAGVLIALITIVIAAVRIDMVSAATPAMSNPIYAGLPDYCRYNLNNSTWCANPWFSAPETDDYYSFGLNIDYNQSGLIDIIIKGAGYTTTNETRGVYSVNLKTNDYLYNQSAGGSVVVNGVVYPAMAITSVASDYNFRGTTYSGNGNWTNVPSNGGRVAAKLNLDRIGTIPADGQSHNYGVPVYSCFKTDDSTNYSGSIEFLIGEHHCDITIVTIQITRAASPWALANTSSVNKTTAAPGETANFTHTVKNNAFPAKNDSGNNVWVTSRVYQYSNTGNNTTKPADFDNHQFCPIADGWYSITTGVANNRAVDVQGGIDNAGNDTNVWSYNSNGSLAQKWYFTCETAGTYRGMYTIATPPNLKGETLLLDAIGGGTTNGSKVGVWDKYGNQDNNHWKVIKETDGFSILSYKGLALDIEGGSSGSGANIQLYTINGTAAQKWYIKKWVNPPSPVPSGYTYTSADDPDNRVTSPYTLKDEALHTAIGANATPFNKSNTVTLTLDASGPGATEKTYCQFVRTTFTGRNNAIHLDSTPKCVNVKGETWTINLQTSASATCAGPTPGNDNCLKPGDTLTFTHQAQQAGPSATDQVVNFSLSHPTAQAGSVTWTADSTTNPINNFASGRSVDTNFVTVRTEDKLITQADVGQYFCSQITADPGGGVPSTVAKSSDPNCVYIPYDYELIPDTVIAGGTSGAGSKYSNVSYGDGVRFEGGIRNENGPTKSRLVNWEAFVFVVPHTDSTALELKTRQPDTALSIATVRSVYGLSSVTYLEPIGTLTNQNNCVGTYNAIDVFYPPRRVVSDPDHNNDTILCRTNDLASILNNLDLGDRLCFAIWVSNSWATPNEQGSTDRSYSQPSCVTVSKSPQLQLRGADAESGAARFGRTTLTGSQYEGGFIGSYSSNQERGSWSQYGLLSNGRITSFGATGYTTPDAVHLGKACKLFFANTTGNGGSNCSSDSGHGWQGVSDRVISLPAVAERSASDLDQLVSATTYQELPSTSTPIRLQDLGSGTYYVKQSLLIEASRLTRNQHLTLVAADPLNTITIAGNIDLDPDDTYDTLAEIPSLTIIADRINIQGFSTLNGLNGQPITKLYGTYIAKERFDSCTYQYKTTSPEAWALDGVALAGITNTPLSNGAGLCREPLTITGAIISKDRPDFRRTHGASKEAPAVPSEIIQYTPNLYLTPYVLSQDGNANDWRLGDLKQLPARL